MPKGEPSRNKDNEARTASFSGQSTIISALLVIFIGALLRLIYRRLITHIRSFTPDNDDEDDDKGLDECGDYCLAHAVRPLNKM